MKSKQKRFRSNDRRNALLRFLAVLFGILLTAGTVLAQTVTVSVPDEKMSEGKNFRLPVKVSNLTGLSVFSFDFTLVYDASVLTAQSAQTSGSLSASWGPATTHISAGQIQVGMGGTTALSGSGNLIYINFHVKAGAAVGKTSPLTFIKFQFNEGSPPAHFNNGTFTVIQDKEPPVITAGPSAQNVTAHSAEIRWNTDEPATGKVAYGTSASYGQVLENSALVASHSLKIHPLKPSTTYHYRVYSTDKLGNGPTISEDDTFRTADIIARLPSLSLDPGAAIVFPLTITDVSEQGITRVELTILFDGSLLSATGVSTDGTIISAWNKPSFSNEPGKITVSMQGSNPLSGHGVLVNLQFRISSGVKIGRSTPLTFQTFSLKTSASETIPSLTENGLFTVEDTQPPKIVSGPGVETITSKSAVITWETNEKSTSLVKFGTGTSYGWQKNNQNRVKTHSVLLSNLSPSTTYHFAAGSVDSSGNGPTWSEDQSFSTEAGSGILVSVPDAGGQAGSDVTIPIGISDASGQNIRSYTLVLAYNSDLIQALSADESGTLTSGWGKPAVKIVDGQVVVQGESGSNLAGGGTLVKLLFRVKSSVTDGLTAPISIVFVQLNNGWPEASIKNGVLTLRGTPDTQAPQIIFGPFVDNISSAGARVVWVTDEPADGFVQYGAGAGYGLSAGSPELETVHRVVMAGLSPGSVYHFQVQSADRWGNGPAASSDATFKTTSGGEVLVLLPDQMRKDGAAFDWPVQIGDVTGKKVYSSDIIVRYDPNILTALSASTAGTRAASWGSPVFTPGNGKIIIAMGGIYTLSGSGTLVKIRFRVKSGAPEKIETPVEFEKFVFNEGTPAAIFKGGLLTVKDVTPPKITAAPQVVSKTAASATILWATDEPSTGTVEFGTTSAYGRSVESGELEKSHIVVLTELESGVTYHFRVSSKDGSGNGPTVSSDRTFQTVSRNPFVLRIPSTAFDVGRTFDLPVELDSLGNRSVYSLDFILKFDSKALKMTRLLTAGTLTAAWSNPVVWIGEDSVRVRMQSTEPVTQNGTLFKIQFQVKSGGVYNKPTPVFMENMLVNSLSSGFVIRGGTFTLVDRTPPKITAGPSAAQVTARSVHIVWSTNEPSDSQIDYGTSTSYDLKLSDSDFMTYHDMAISGLSPSTTYHFRVSSTDTIGNGPVRSSDTTFTTTAGNEISVAIPDTLAPIGQTISCPVTIEDVTGKGIRNYQLTIRFDSTAIVPVGAEKAGTLTAAWGEPSVTKENGRMSVSQTGGSDLTGSGTLIRLLFKIRENAEPGKDVALIFSTFTFNNGAIPASPNSARWRLVDRTPPVVTEGPEVVDVGVNSAAVRWKTNELTTGKIEYGKTAGYGQFKNAAAVDSVHLVALENLQPLTVYHFRVSATDTAGNGPVTTADATFRTLSDTVTVSLPEMTVAIGSVFDVPITVTNLTGFQIKKIQMDMTIDSTTLSPIGAFSDSSMTAKWGTPFYSVSKNVFHVEISGAEPLKGKGVLIWLRFRLLGGVYPGAVLNFSFDSFQLNSGTPAVKINSGKIHVVQGHAAGGIEVSLPDTSLLPGTRLLLPVSVSDVTDKGIHSLALTLSADNKIVKFHGIETKNSLTEIWGSPQVKISGDSLTVSLQGTAAVSDSGTLLFIDLETLPAAQEGDTTELKFDRFRFNQGNPFANVKNGFIRIYKRHDAISGFVFESDSVTAVKDAVVSAKETDTGQVKTGVSDSTGSFLVASLDSTKTYTVSVSKPGYTSPDPVQHVKTGTSDLKFYLEKQNGFIDGWVKSPENKAVVGALVVADDGHGHFGSGNTDSTGHFAVNHLAKRFSYTVTVTKFGFHDTVLQNVRVNQTVQVQMKWFYGEIHGMVRDTNRVAMDSVFVQALSLKKGTRVDSFLTDKTGKYDLDSLKTDQYLIYALREGFVSTPNQVTVNLAPGDSVASDFTMERAVLAAIDISGNQEIPNNVSSRFDFTGKTAKGQVMALRSPVWKLWPKKAGVASQGIVYPNPDYFGEANLSVTDQFTGISDTLRLSVYAPVTAATNAVFENAEGVSLQITPGSVDQPQKIKIQSVSLPSVKKSTKRFSAPGKGYILKPGGYKFQESVHLEMPVPAGFAAKRVKIGRWNQDKAQWDVLETNVVTHGDTSKLSSELSEFSLLAVLNPAKDLGMESLRFYPNPFSPKIDTDLDGYPGLTIEFLITSRDARRPFVTVQIYSLLGQKVRTLVNHEPQNKDQRLKFRWDGLTDDGRMARNGRYVVKVDVSDATGTKTKLGTVILVK